MIESAVELHANDECCMTNEQLERREEGIKERLFNKPPNGCMT